MSHRRRWIRRGARTTLEPSERPARRIRATSSPDLPRGPPDLPPTHRIRHLPAGSATRQVGGSSSEGQARPPTLQPMRRSQRGGCRGGLSGAGASLL